MGIDEDNPMACPLPVKPAPPDTHRSAVPGAHHPAATHAAPTKETTK
jgi:hypothetical protein